MAKTFLLSICIPTYNRAEFLLNNLNTLSKIISRGVEIVVSDDASTDNTKEVVEDFIHKNPKINIKYIESKERIFFDKNLIKIVDNASGKFCWLLGDDDLPKVGSIKKIISVIEEYPNLSLIYLNYSRFDNLMKKVTAESMINRVDVDKDILFKTGYNFYFRETKDSYFKYLGTNTITMCTDVINRKKWQIEIKKLHKYIGLNFIHSFVIGTIIKGSNSVYFVSKPQVQYLANNSRVWPNNVWKDYNKIFLGYLSRLGYPYNKLKKMEKYNKENEQKEAFMKNRYFKVLFRLTSPLYYRFQYLRNKLSK
jgi:abequosyltransferase